MNLKNLLLCILTAFAVVSCTSDIGLNDVNTIKEQESKSEITLQIEPFKNASVTETRATFNSVTDGDNFVVEFNFMDILGVKYLDEDKCYTQIRVDKGKTFTSTEGIQTIKFENTNIGYGRSLIFYPYDPGICWLDNDNFFMYFGSQYQKGFNESNASNRNYYISKTIEIGAGEKLPTKKISLYPLNSVFKVIVTNLPQGNYSKIELETIDGSASFYKDIYGEVADGKFIPKIDELDEYDKASKLVTYFSDCSIENAGEYFCYFSAYPSQTGKFRIKVTNTDGKVYYSKEVFPNENTCFSDENPIKAGYGYELKCTLDIPYPVPEEVDLGLPSGLKWANANLGANSPTEFGDYFEWGVTETTPVYDEWWEGHKWRNEDGTFKKYNLTDKLTTLEKEDDAAYVNLGNGWRMPTHAELQELINNCYIVWTKNYDDTNVAGCIVYKAKRSTDKGIFVKSDETPLSTYDLSDTHIFLPANGAWYLGGHYDTTECNYWSSTLYGLNKWHIEVGLIMSFNPNKCEANDNNYARFCHVGIRPVRE